MMKISILLSLLFLSALLCCQTTRIIGRVVDSLNAGLDHASIILLDPADSSMISFTQSDNNGKFVIENVASNRYLVQINYIGFQNHWHNIDVKTLDTPYDLGTVHMIAQTYILPAMEVKAEHSPIRFGKDTVEYNAAAFKTQAGDVVEDLLKKLPGVEVERDGSVKAYGEKVQNVLVDGKEFFGKDTRIATKNLEADAVDKVQVFDKKSDEAAFTGVEDGRDEKTINLQLKEDKKKGYFGNMNGGVGSNERYSAKANVNRFSSGSRFSFIGTANNINEQGFSIQEYIDFMGGIGSFMSGGGGRVRIELNDNSGIPLMGSGQIAGIQNSIAGGLNYTIDLSSKTEMTGSYFYNHFGNTLTENVYRQNISDQSSYNTSEDNDQQSKSNNHSVNLYVKHKLDSTQHLTFRLNGSLSDSKLDNLIYSNTFQSPLVLLNESQSEYHAKGTNYQIKPSLSWMKRLGKPGRSLVSKVSVNLRNNERDGNLSSHNKYYTLSNLEDSIHQKQYLDDDQNQYEVSLNYTEPLGGKKYLEFNALHSNYSHKTNKDYFDILSNNEEQRNDLLSKNYQNEYGVNSAGLNFSINKKKYYFTAGFKLQHSLLNGDLQNIPEGNISKSYSRLLPAMFGEYQFGIAHHINFDYQTYLQEPSIEQLQPTVNNTDPLNIYIGNPELNPEYTHELNSSYFLYDQFNFTSVFANLGGGYTQNRITDIVHIDSAFRRIIQPVNVPYEKNLRAGIDFTTPIRPLKINTRIRLGSGFSDGIIYVNEEKNNVQRFRYSLNFSIENRNKDIFDALIGWKINNNKTSYSISSLNNQQYRETSLYSELTLNLSKTLTLKSNFELRSYTSSLFKENISIPLWELSVSNYFLKDNKLKLQLKVFDVLNENQGIRRTSQLNYVEEQRSNVLGRYALIQIAYSIRGFSSKKNGIEIKVEQ
jgi:hypothetical protein